MGRLGFKWLLSDTEVFLLDEDVLAIILCNVQLYSIESNQLFRLQLRTALSFPSSSSSSAAAATAAAAAAAAATAAATVAAATAGGAAAAVCWLVGCLTSQQHASVSQGRICSHNISCCHTEIEVADQTFYLTQSQYTDTGPTSPSADPITPGAWQGSHWSAIF